jgi:Molybdopterin-binding domain of aldehyde dehydrogenase
MNMLANIFMRAPGESVGTFALESAIDELAIELEMDPIELYGLRDGHSSVRPDAGRCGTDDADPRRRRDRRGGGARDGAWDRARWQTRWDRVVLARGLFMGSAVIAARRCNRPVGAMRRRDFLKSTFCPELTLACT